MNMDDTIDTNKQNPDSVTENNNINSDESNKKTIVDSENINDIKMLGKFKYSIHY